jgi:hypothetical protein
MPTTPITPENLWDAIERIGTEEGSSASLRPTVIAKLVELGFVKLGANGLRQLTAKGQQAMIVFESGDGEVPELDNYGL